MFQNTRILPILRAERIVLDQVPSFFGTAFQVAGTWYVRFEGGGGVLLPLECTPSVRSQLCSGRAYQFEGRVVRDHQGCPRAVEARGVKHIGDGHLGG